MNITEFFNRLNNIDTNINIICNSPFTDIKNINTSLALTQISDIIYRLRTIETGILKIYEKQHSERITQCKNKLNN